MPGLPCRQAGASSGQSPGCSSPPGDPPASLPRRAPGCAPGSHRQSRQAHGCFDMCTWRVQAVRQAHGYEGMYCTCSCSVMRGVSLLRVLCNWSWADFGQVADLGTGDNAWQQLEQAPIHWAPSAPALRCYEAVLAVGSGQGQQGRRPQCDVFAEQGHHSRTLLIGAVHAVQMRRGGLLAWHWL